MFANLRQWWKEASIEARAQIEADKEHARLTDPTMFTETQRTFLKSLFPKMWTHFDNFSQEELLRIVVTMNTFGWNIDEESKIPALIDVFIHQQIITCRPDNNHLLRRL